MKGVQFIPNNVTITKDKIESQNLVSWDFPAKPVLKIEMVEHGSFHGQLAKIGYGVK